MKKVLTFCLLALAVFSLSAQPTVEKKTILFLIPFYSNEYNSTAATSVRSSNDIYSINSFLLMGFWAGAKVALDEYAEQNIPLEIIVKDVTEDESKLISIMEDENLMERVDVIIGPFFSKPFGLAAKYAKKYGIPIVNPFTNRRDILNNNEYVYKLTPTISIRPAMIAYQAERYPQHNIILYEDTAIKNTEQSIYIQYFKENNIPFTHVQSQSQIINNLQTGANNIILTFGSNTAKIMVLSRDLLYKAKNEDIILVVPDEWLESNTYDVEYYSKLNLHFFSNYFVDYSDPETQIFIQKYKDKYKSIPTMDNYAFQGYDITRYFIELARNDGDIDRVKINALSYPLSFDKVKDGGYENVNVHFLEIFNDEIRTVIF
ncbi:MAG: ABC transporter substrate-binding protein [Bacteroidales bacterium]|nr:ABC transporter substrate-binding protein [Bacteroidales bacterium]